MVIWVGAHDSLNEILRFTQNDNMYIFPFLIRPQIYKRLRRCKMMRDIKKVLEGEQEKVEKKHFEEPKLEFIQPKLTKHGDVTKITFNGGFFGGFSP